MIIGIDPGLSGAIAVFDTVTEGRVSLAVHDMPTHTITVAGKKRRHIDGYLLARMVDEIATLDDIRMAVVEDVHAMPKQGVTSSFKFGFVTGIVHGVICANLIPMRVVAPQVWKRAFGLTSDKDASRRCASAMFPRFAHLWPLAGHDGRAEAALLALYGAKTL